MRRWLAPLAFGIAHCATSLVTFWLSVIGVIGLALGASPRGPLFYVWEVISFALGSPIVTGVLFLFPSFPWKTAWVFLPFIANSSLWVWVAWRVIPAIRRRFARAA